MDVEYGMLEDENLYTEADNIDCEAFEEEVIF